MKKQVKAKPSDEVKKPPIRPVLSSNTSSRLPWVPILVVLALTFIVFSPTLKNGFVNWDDDRNVYENKTLEGPLSSKQIKNVFTTPVIGNYNPLAIASFAIEKHYFKGFNPQKMHWTNLLLHLFCTFMVYKIFGRLGLNVLFAALGALLFGIHPLRVESVAWITERKDVLFASFFLPALYLYIKNLESHSFMRSVIIFILFMIGLFAKIQMVALPLTFLAIDYWKDRKLGLKLVFEKIHFFLGAIAFGLIGLYYLKQEGSLDTNQVHEGIVRLFIGSYSLITYLIKWLFPYMTLPLYPYPEKISIWHYLSIIPFLALFVGLYIAYKKNMKPLIFGFAFFFFNIVFLLQILGAGQGYLADRFTYIAYIGLFFIFCYYIQEWVNAHQESKMAVFGSVGVYMIFLAYLSYKQCFFWKDSGTLWTRVIEYYDNTPLPFNNRANYYRDAKMYDRAMADYDRAIQLKADHPTYNSRAKMYFEKNQDDKALADYNIAIQKKPTAEYFVNRGAAYAKLGRLDEAILDFNKGLSMDPSWKVGYLNRSIMHQQKGNFQGALDDINSYLKFDPYNPEIWYEGGRCSRAVNQVAESIRYYNEAIRLNPKFGIAYLERGRTNQQLGNVAAANADLQKARELGEKVEPLNNIPVK
ncbi:MAG: tetratricopeptide repeat protein [Saprospiraceae bacterium]|nr:tetratricopeptide repeat protein [Saprospiraceae bacterium]